MDQVTLPSNLEGFKTNDTFVGIVLLVLATLFLVGTILSTIVAFKDDSSNGTKTANKVFSVINIFTSIVLVGVALLHVIRL